MDMGVAIEGFRALAQPTRLAAFRLLVRAGPEGRPAGAVAEELEVPHNTLSTHLAALERAGLVRARRESRSIIYSADLEGARALISFLIADCCDGRPEICRPLAEALT
jgi:ArsR family transcriptional regulator